MSIADMQNGSASGWVRISRKLYGAKENNGIWLVYTKHMSGINLDCANFGLIDELLQKKWWNCNHASELACTDHYQGGGHNSTPQKACFTQQFHIPGIYQVYACHISSAARLRACRVSQARLEIDYISYTWYLPGV